MLIIGRIYQQFETEDAFRLSRTKSHLTRFPSSNRNKY